MLALVLSVSLNVAMYQKNEINIKYSLQGSYQTGGGPEKEYLVIDSEEKFFMYSNNGDLLNTGEITLSAEKNLYTMTTENNQIYGLFRWKKAAYIFDGKSWTCFIWNSSAIRTFT